MCWPYSFGLVHKVLWIIVLIKMALCLWGRDILTEMASDKPTEMHVEATADYLNFFYHHGIWRCRSPNSAILPLVNTANETFHLRCYEVEYFFFTLFATNRWERHFGGNDWNCLLLHHKVADIACFDIALLQVLCTERKHNQQS